MPDLWDLCGVINLRLHIGQAMSIAHLLPHDPRAAPRGIQMQPIMHVHAPPILHPPRLHIDPTQSRVMAEAQIDTAIHTMAFDG